MGPPTPNSGLVATFVCKEIDVFTLLNVTHFVKRLNRNIDIFILPIILFNIYLIIIHT